MTDDEHPTCFHADCTNNATFKTQKNGEPRHFCQKHEHVAELYNNPVQQI